MALHQGMIGQAIYTQDGDHLGKVKEIQGRFLKVDAPMQTDYWLSEDCVAAGTGNEVRLSITKDALDNYKTDEPDEVGVERTTTTTAPRASTDVERGTGERVELREEQLRARTEQVPAGEVRVEKDVVTERQEMDVPVTHEEVVVERRPVEGGRPAGGDIREGQEIRVPVSQERVQVEKEPVVTEEVTVGKQEVTETQRVGSEVRREEPRVEREGDVRVSGTTGTNLGWSDVSSQYRQQWQSRSGSAGGRWEEYEPGYRYGYEMANDPRYQGRDFNDVEADLRGGYSSWSQRSGYQSDPSAWDRIKEGVRDAFSGSGSRRR